MSRAISYRRGELGANTPESSDGRLGRTPGIVAEREVLHTRGIRSGSAWTSGGERGCGNFHKRPRHSSPNHCFMFDGSPLPSAEIFIDRALLPSLGFEHVYTIVGSDASAHLRSSSFCPMSHLTQRLSFLGYAIANGWGSRGDGIHSLEVYETILEEWKKGVGRCPEVLTTRDRVSTRAKWCPSRRSIFNIFILWCTLRVSISKRGI